MAHLRVPRIPVVGLALGLLLAPAPPPAAADGRLPGEATELTAEVRAAALKHVDVIVGGKPEAEKSVRALLVLGPVVYPVLENALRLAPPDAARPRLNYLKTLLLAKAEPEFEYLRDRIRRKVLGGAVTEIQTELVGFRLGRPDPEKPGKRIPPTVAPTVAGNAAVYRSADGTMVVAFGTDATGEKPDAADVIVSDPKAGFVGALGGKPLPFARRSGRGGAVTVDAPMGFAYAYAYDGAAGVKPGGQGGEAGVAQAHGGVGQFEHQGTVGANAPP